MGTRSVTIIMDENEELCRIYRQFDGYPEGMGLDLAKACNREITNGICGIGTAAAKDYITSNGMSELATQVIVDLKTASPIGNVYLNSPNREICNWAEYLYIIRGKDGYFPTIECWTHSDPAGTSIFNPKSNDLFIFKGTSKEWIEKYEEKIEKKPPAKSRKRKTYSHETALDRALHDSLSGNDII